MYYVSKPAPDWNGTAVVNGEFKDIKLKDYRGKYLVFFFYPLDFTFVCPTEIIAFSDSVEQFRNINTEVVACSVDSQFTHLAWINTPRNQGGLGPIKIPLLSDITHDISKAYGVYLEDLGHSLRGLFIIDPKGTLRQITMNDLPVGRSVDETLRLVQAFQYTDSHEPIDPDVAPTLGFRSAKFVFGRYDITLYDVGGGKSMRPVWKNYFPEVYGVIYMVDSSTPDRMEEARETLRESLEHPHVTGKPVLLLANKQDKPEALDEVDLCEQLNLEVIVNTNKCPCRIEATMKEEKKRHQFGSKTWGLAEELPAVADDAIAFRQPNFTDDDD
nr:hypothetical protein BaRGS_013661 [Batillaria attramentaria]